METRRALSILSLTSPFNDSNCFNECFIDNIFVYQYTYIILKLSDSKALLWRVWEARLPKNTNPGFWPGLFMLILVTRFTSTKAYPASFQKRSNKNKNRNMFLLPS